MLDPTVAYCLNPGEEQRIDHPYADGDDCTVLGIDDGLLGQLAIDGERLPRGPLPTSPEIDLEHRLLIATARRGGDEHELTEKAFALTGATIKPRVAEVKGARRHTAAARKALVADAREALVANADLSLADLAHELAVSPFHLSRTFRSVTGHTLARHRVRLRARRALERLAGGERDLARLAADIGFADQSYMCRVIRAETGRTPAALRDALS